MESQVKEIFSDLSQWMKEMKKLDDLLELPKADEVISELMKTKMELDKLVYVQYPGWTYT